MESPRQILSPIKSTVLASNADCPPLLLVPSSALAVLQSPVYWSILALLMPPYLFTKVYETPHFSFSRLGILTFNRRKLLSEASDRKKAPVVNYSHNLP